MHRLAHFHSEESPPLEDFRDKPKATRKLTISGYVPLGIRTLNEGKLLKLLTQSLNPGKKHPLPKCSRD